MMTETTFAAIKTIASVNDLVPRAQAIKAAAEAGDLAGATDGQRRLQTFLQAMTPEALEAHAPVILDTLRVFQAPNGERIASWLRVHVRDNDARAFWGYAEQVLNPRVFGEARLPEFMTTH